MKEFKKELKNLLIKHEISIDRETQYDGNGAACGDEYYFIKDHLVDYENIGELMKELLEEEFLEDK